jgi:hypothetical protein
MGSARIVQRTASGEAAFVWNVCIDHGGFDVLMTERFLYGADIAAVLQQVGGEGMAEGFVVSSAERCGR